jgi:hypothetical protein
MLQVIAIAVDRSCTQENCQLLVVSVRNLGLCTLYTSWN